MLQLQQNVFVVLGFVAVALIVALPVRGQLAQSLRGLLSVFDGLGPLRKFAGLALIAHLTMFAGGKHGGTNDVDGSVLCLSPSPTMESDHLCTTTTSDYDYSSPSVTPEDIARGWQFWEVRTNLDVCYTIPEGAMMASNWWVRGAFEDVVRVPGSEFQIPSFRFPYGSNEYCSAWVFSWGKLRFELGNTNTEIAAVGAPMSAVPYRSRLWSAADTNDSRFVTWENFTLGRQQLTANSQQLTALSAQIELRRNGDFITRSNEVETVYRRIDPEDYDGDGWENGDDPDPYVGEDFSDYFYQELPEGANEADYCWIEVRPRWNSWIDFYGDAPSNLDDPYIYGKAGETYRVQLLIGKTYDVESTQPLDIVAKSDDRIDVSNVESNSFTVVWPVTFTVAEGRAPESRPRLGATWNDGGKSFYVLPDPPWLHGVIAWSDNYCCGVWGDGTNFTYACDNECICEGCTAYGSYWYEGYGLPVWGISCGCHYVEDQGDASVEISFDRSVALFEGTYTNAPGEVIMPIPSNVVLTCHAYGGTYGGQLSIEVETGGRISKVGGDSLPVWVSLAAGEERTYEVVYSPIAGSRQEGDVVASAGIVENFTGETYGEISELTAVRVEIESVVDAPANSCTNRHKFGVGEHVRCKLHPNIPSVNWVNRCGSWENADEFVCPLTATNDPIAAVCGDFSYTPSILVIEPNGIETRNPRCVTYGIRPGRAGWVGLRQEYYVLPLDVSFVGIDVEEVPCTTGTRGGYFSGPEFNRIACHSRDCGAGIWNDIDQNNKMGRFDTTSITMELPRVNAAGEATEDTNCCWTAGWITWDVPFGWAAADASDSNGHASDNPPRIVDPVGRFDPRADCRFEINAEGDVTVRKFGNSAERLITGQLKLNGEIWGTH